ncbi:MAG: hypothetical protein ACOX8W_06655 [bacterium]|jgi:hypothetical protein
MIDGNRPVFLIHQSPQKYAVLPDFLRKVFMKHKDDVQLGTIISLFTMSPNKAEEYISACSRYSDIIIVDLTTHLIYENKGIPKRYKKHYSLLSEEPPQKPKKGWINRVLSKQREFGATILLSPSIAVLNTSKPQALLDVQLDWLKETEDLLKKGEQLFFNLTLESSWLSDKRHLEILLNNLIDLDTKDIYLRVRWPAMQPRYGQLRDNKILEGYKEICNFASSESRALILPTTGLTGWFLTALGASGFSIGLSKDQQSYSEDLIIRRQKDAPSIPRKMRYFERQLLHTIELPTHDALLDLKETKPCQCEFCKALEANEPNRKTAWDYSLASLHQIRHTVDLTAQLNVKNPRATALKEVQNALSYKKAITDRIKLIGENNPQHLEVWERILA